MVFVYYPVLKVPPKILDAMSTKINDPVLPDYVYLELEDDSLTNLSAKGCLFSIPSFILLAILSNLFYPDAVLWKILFIFPISVFIISLFLGLLGNGTNNRNAEKNKLNEQNLKKYLSDQIDYEWKMADMYYKQNQRNQLINEALKFTQRPEYENIGVKGFSEDYFFNQLLMKYPEKIFRNKIIKYFGYSDPYQPDIIYFDKEKNFAIDIEIDEPYELRSLKPIHFVSNNDVQRDSKRDRFFLDCNWIIIKFSEEQVVKQTSYCVEYIEKIINGVFVFNNFNHINIDFFRPQRRWTQEEAILMAQNGYRNTYLNR